MEQITIGQIALGITFLVGLFSGFAYLKKHFEGWISGSLKGNFDELRDDIKSLKKHIDEVDLENCKNFLVRVLADIERGTPKDEVEMMRFWEEYQHYITKGGNSYIKEKVEKCRRDGKL